MTENDDDIFGTMESKETRLFSIFNFVANAFSKNKREIILTGYAWDCGDGWAKEHRLNGELHRVFGPAAFYADGDDKKGDGIASWYRHGKKDRKNGPAVEKIVDGKKLPIRWCIDDKELSMEDIKTLPEKQKRKLKIPKKYW